MSNEIVTTLKQEPMRPFQILAVTICIVINMLDGFDVLVVSFTAPIISEEWGLEPQAIGILLSSGLFGMAAGSLFLAPLADYIGRRDLILWCLSIISIGMLASAFTNSVLQLSIMRIFTGLGIGGMLASITTMTAEYSSDRREGFNISLVQSGYPIGATIGGTIAAFLIISLGWRSVFIFGAICSAVMIPVVYRFLPESVEYLLDKKPKSALAQVNLILIKLGKPLLQKLPDTSQSEHGRTSVFALTNSNLRIRTLLIWSGFFMVMLSFYFVLSWTPTLLSEAGLRVEQGISGAVLMNIGGVLGGTSLGFLTTKYPAHYLTVYYMLACAIFMTIFGWIEASLGLMLFIGFVIGFFVFGSMIGLYSLAPALYPVRIRNTGMGWAIGIGRLGAILGPSAAGYLLSRGWSGADCFIAFSVPLLIAMLAVLALSQQSESITIHSSA